MAFGDIGLKPQSFSVSAGFFLKKTEYNNNGTENMTITWINIDDMMSSFISPKLPKRKIIAVLVIAIK